MPRFEVFAGSTLIGHTELEKGDAPMGVANGRFVPLPAYQSVQPSCRATSEQARLGLSVRSTGAGPLPAAGGVQIIDYSQQFGDDAIEVFVNGIPYPLYERLFPDHVAAYANQFRTAG